MATLRKLKVAIKTSSEAFAGTDATIYVAMVTSGGGRIYRLPTRKEDLEVGRLDIYPVLLPDGPLLADLQGIMLINGMNGQSPAWKILWVKVDAVDSENRSWRLVDAMLECWLDARDDTAPAAFLPILRPAVELGQADAVGETNIVLPRIS